MKITAQVHNDAASHDVSVVTGGQSQPLAVPARGSGRGSAVNGGEFLMLAWPPAIAMTCTAKQRALA
jgi:hypothetical protein